MNESTTGSSDPDVSPTTETDQTTENVPDSEHESSDDTSVMTRALKHELEDKGMTVEIEDDGETLSAEKLDQSYRIHSDGTVEGNGVLKDGIEDIVADLDPVEDTGAETEETSTEPATEDSPDESASNTNESAGSEQRETNEAVNNEEGEVASESATPNVSTSPESTADAVEDDNAAEADEKANEEPAEEAEVEAEAEEEEAEEEEDLPTGTVGQFEASIEVGHLQDVVDAVSAVVEECRIHLTEDGLVIRAVDPANVAMINEQVSADGFEAYDTDCGEIGVRLDPLDEILGIADNDDDLIQFDYDAQTRKIQITVNAVEYTLALIDPASIRQEPDIPDLDLPASVGVEQSDLKQAVRAADMVSDHIKLRVDEREQSFIAEAEGDTDDVEFELSADDLENTSFGAASSLFSLDYLKDLRKPVPKDTIVRMDMGEEFPVKLHFEMADGTVNVEYMLAPRIESS
jgi:proliferating cell nuclear antigen